MITEFQAKPAKRLTYAEKAKAGLVAKKKRTRIKPRSAKKSEWEAKYFAQVESDARQQECFSCHAYGTKDSFDRHHTHGRSKENILIYKYCCRDCHNWIHENPNQARKLGLLHF